jgi:hypothetical protein
MLKYPAPTGWQLPIIQLDIAEASVGPVTREADLSDGEFHPMERQRHEWTITGISTHDEVLAFLEGRVEPRIVIQEAPFWSHYPAVP